VLDIFKWCAGSEQEVWVYLTGHGAAENKVSIAQLNHRVGQKEADKISSTELNRLLKCPDFRDKIHRQCQSFTI
ncbi:hypothetical protein ACFL0V_07370, partial [Nanoarchaeota archaeon]